jgi:hypothetical protein
LGDEQAEEHLAVIDDDKLSPKILNYDSEWWSLFYVPLPLALEIKELVAFQGQRKDHWLPHGARDCCCPAHPSWSCFPRGGGHLVEDCHPGFRNASTVGFVMGEHTPQPALLILKIFLG